MLSFVMEASDFGLAINSMIVKSGKNLFRFWHVGFTVCQMKDKRMKQFSEIIVSNNTFYRKLILKANKSVNHTP